jgi:hypothetical protein
MIFAQPDLLETLKILLACVPAKLWHSAADQLCPHGVLV